MQRHRLALALLALGIAGAGELAVRKTFGMWLPWEIPERLDVCGRRYHPSAVRMEPDADTVVVQVRATFQSLPIPLPELHETSSALPYAGCPIQIHLIIGDVLVPYGPPEGGP